MFGPFRRSPRRSRAGASADAGEAPDDETLVRGALEELAGGALGAAVLRLDDAGRERLARLGARFLATRRFESGAGFEPDAPLRARIAIEACLPLANLPDGLDAYARARTVVVHPSGFRVEQRWTDEDGIEHEREAELSGEAWEGGPVVLAADDVGDSRPGFSVVVHEFAHVLDAGNGAVNGFPDVREPALRASWPGIFSRASAELAEAVARGEPTPLDEYALEDPAEFFAVATETFFTDAAALARRWPALYRALSDFYRQDPAGGGCRHAGRPPRRRRGSDG